jgi:hypothetical protein
MEILALKAILSALLNEKGLSVFASNSFALLLLLIGFLLLGQIVFWVTRKLILSFFIKIAARTTSKFDDILIENKVPRVLSYLPVLFLYTKPFLFFFKILVKV